MHNEPTYRPFMLKKIRVESRKLVQQAAKKKGMTMSEWVDQAIQNQYRVELIGEAEMPVIAEPVLLANKRLELLEQGQALLFRRIDYLATRSGM